MTQFLFTSIDYTKRLTRIRSQISELMKNVFELEFDVDSLM